MKTIAAILFTVLTIPPMASQQSISTSTLEVFDLETRKRTVILRENTHFEAPNWSKDGQYFIINQEGGLYTVSLDGKTKKVLPTGTLSRCNNDHGISFDGNTLAISNNDTINGNASGNSRIYTMPISGGTPKRITPMAPSYWHGWSPDGKTLVYTARRNGHWDIYSIPSEGGKEMRLTDSPGLDDGPEYSPDGKYIYYNSMQSGTMEIWRMWADGSNQEQLTKDAYSNWFAHPSPNGNQFVYIAYLEDQGDRHPPMKQVALRLYDLEDGTIQTLCEFTGGQGTINVPSWSPDGKRFAFVSYSGR
ncbi:transporter [Flavobacteriaceae bacterium TP-CH-4]|uniref:Transporter n=1 Tax=Pelagihabitans pacificus TaxID=2696054 RepID=A0A967AU03_9FLAO|nr:PD40 domain-containing protein [Pelagihabitans pacificus]NHF60263.1 transporter [Pelagihabitans pacificus]